MNNLEIEEELRSRDIKIGEILENCSGRESSFLIVMMLGEVARAFNLQTKTYIEQRNNYPLPVNYIREIDYTKLIVEAVEKRDKLTEQIKELERTAESLPEGARDFLLATAKTPIANQLEEMDGYISKLQKEMERGKSIK